MQVLATTDNDWATYRTARIAALTEAPEAFGASLETALAADESFWRQRAGSPGGFIVLEESQPVGLLHAYEDGGECYLVSIWVHSRLRGRGIVEVLLEESRKFALSQGFRELALWVMDNNARAIAAYRRCGFMETGDTQPEGDRTEIKMIRPTEVSFLP